MTKFFWIFDNICKLLMPTIDVCRCYTRILLRILFVRIILLAYKIATINICWFICIQARKVMKSSFFLFQSISRRYPSLHHFEFFFYSNFQRNVHSSQFDGIRFVRWRSMLFVFLLTLQPLHHLLPILFFPFHLDRHFVYRFQNKEKSIPKKRKRVIFKFL